LVAASRKEQRDQYSPSRGRHDRPRSRVRQRTVRGPGPHLPLLPQGRVSADLRSLHQIGGRDADSFYRDRWSHDKVVRSTHGVNCTGSCSWKVYVKDGIITWEAQQTDYPSTGPDRPEYEPLGAAFSWYTCSPTRVRYPYVRGSLEVLSRDPLSP
jgi:nitrate reductase alpha subunit